ncbi:MAG: M48 family metallopeptidase [Rikenellaceae bacterium]|nr:M48 family metallopeptidase [Rikenellaceae bacterium]
MALFRKKTNAAPHPATVVTHTVEYPGIGEVRVAVSRRAKRITLSVKPDGTVRLAVPYGVPAENGMRFLESKKEWVLRTRAKYPARPAVLLPPYTTRSHTLVLLPCDTPPESPIKVRITATEIIVAHSDRLDPAGVTVQNAVKKGIEEAWRAEAKEYLPVRLAWLAEQTGLRYNSATVRNTVSKWGSCSARNDISLSLHLMRLPGHLIDYILIHELCHTVHKNHGPKFHALLNRLTGDRHPALRRELRGYHTRW